jgi:hypothetical protein
MKHSIRVMLMALLVVSLWRCSDQQPENSAPRDVQFAVRTANTQAKIGRTAGFRNTHGGGFDYINVAASTPAAQAQLLDLAINYGWTITH